MNLYGKHISDDELNAAWEAACAKSLTYTTVKSLKAALSNPRFTVASCAVDRLLQMKRKAGDISFNSRDKRWEIK